MRWIIALAIGIKTFIQPRESTKSCGVGHTLHTMWQSCPLCDLQSSADDLNHPSPQQPVVAMRLLEPQHAGRSLLLAAGNYRLGTTPNCDLVITPATVLAEPEAAHFHLVVDAKMQHIYSMHDAQLLQIGNKEYRDARLYDRDRFTIFGVACEIIRLNQPQLAEAA